MPTYTHPQYPKYTSLWCQMQDTYEGSYAVKRKGETYLPKTQIQIADGTQGDKDYEAYKFRADYYGVVEETVNHYLGVLHEKDDNLKLPGDMGNMLEYASADGESLQGVMRTISYYQLLYGRCLIYAYYPEKRPIDGPILPIFRIYPAPAIINWSDAGEFRDFIIIEEVIPDFDQNYNWTEEKYLRILQVNDGIFTIGTGKQSEGLNNIETIQPLVNGRTTDTIPATFVNANNIARDISKPPLLDLSNVALSIYNQSADHRQNLHYQASSVFWIGNDDASEDEDNSDGSRTPEQSIASSESAKLRISPNSYISVPSNGKVGFARPGSDGLEQQQAAIELSLKRAKELGGRLDQPETRQIQSGDALKVRQNTSHITLTSLAKTRQEAMLDVMKKIARGRGISERDIEENLIIETNTDFTTNDLRIASLRELFEIHRTNPEKMPFEVVAEYMRKSDFTTLSAEELLEAGKREIAQGDNNNAGDIREEDS